VTRCHQQHVRSCEMRGETEARAASRERCYEDTRATRVREGVQRRDWGEEGRREEKRGGGEARKRDVAGKRQAWG